MIKIYLHIRIFGIPTPCEMLRSHVAAVKGAHKCYEKHNFDVLRFAVLTSEERQQLFPPVLPAFVRFCKAFPPLMEDVVGLLLQYGRICASEASRRPLHVEGLTSGQSSSASSSFNRSPRHTTDPLERVSNIYK